MQDHELYRRILGIEAPWQVERVELKLSQGEVHVYLAHQNQPEWLVRNAVPSARSTIISRSGNGDIWTLSVSNYSACRAAALAVPRARGETVLGRARQPLYR